MPSRRRLDADHVVDVAIGLAEQEGPEALTLGALARTLGVATPSLYNHIDSLADLRTRISVRALAQLHRRLADAVAGRAGADAVAAVLRAFRRFGTDRPHLYAFTVAAPGGDEAHVAASTAVTTVVMASLRAYGLEGDGAVHAARVLRAGVHGFVDLELNGGFGLPTDIEESFEHLVDALCRSLEVHRCATS